MVPRSQQCEHAALVGRSCLDGVHDAHPASPAHAGADRPARRGRADRPSGHRSREHDRRRTAAAHPGDACAGRPCCAARLEPCAGPADGRDPAGTDGCAPGCAAAADSARHRAAVRRHARVGDAVVDPGVVGAGCARAGDAGAGGTRAVRSGAVRSGPARFGAVGTGPVRPRAVRSRAVRSRAALDAAGSRGLAHADAIGARAGGACTTGPRAGDSAAHPAAVRRTARRGVDGGAAASRP